MFSEHCLYDIIIIIILTKNVLRFCSADLDMQQSQCFGETLYGHVFSDVELRYPSDGSVFGCCYGFFNVSQGIGYVSYLL